MAAIVGVAGRPIVEFGGAHAWRVYTKRDIVVSFQWLDVGHESGEPQPCMCLYPVRPKIDGGVFAVTQDKGYLYLDRRGRPTKELPIAALNACSTMGFFPDQSTLFRICDIIYECMPDLISMPCTHPAALKRAKPIQGIEVTVKNGDTVIAEGLH